MGNASNLAATLLLFGVVLGASPAMAETPVEGAYENMSPGNQKVALALFEAQAAATGRVPGRSATAESATGGSTIGPESLTLDEIAALKQRSRGWGQVFGEMKSRGLVQERNLGQVVSRYGHRPETTTTVGTESGYYSAGGRSSGPGGHASSLAGSSSAGARPDTNRSGPSAHPGGGQRGRN